MKSPEELGQRLARQWGKAENREARLLDHEGTWPISLPIGRPAPRVITSDLDAVKKHVERWRQVRIGTIVWETTSYQATSEPVDIPGRWELGNPSEWVAACDDRMVREEFKFLVDLIERTDPTFHSLLIRRRSLWRERSLDDVVRASRIALDLEPSCAAGKPLRMLSLLGNDTKFLERNRILLTSMLDVRFDGEVSELGLEEFLGAAKGHDDWLLVADLDSTLLLFRKQRVSSSELTRVALPAKRILIVENESSLHQLPALPETIAVLGTGFNLSWVEAPWLRDKRVAYWGDLDTWGLQWLAKARSAVPELQSLMMTEEAFEAYAELAVPEPVCAGDDPPEELNSCEQALYRRLLREPNGRLEQEFLPMEFVQRSILDWAAQA